MLGTQWNHIWLRIIFVVHTAQQTGTRRKEKIMPRKGEMSDQDAADEVIRNNADHYNVVVYIPQRNSRVCHSTPDLEDAIVYAESVYDDKQYARRPRASMVYAVDAYDRFALMGTTNRFNRQFKPNVVKIY